MKLDIRLVIPGLPFDPNDPLRGSLGGSETAGVQMAKALAKLGHKVTVFANVPHAGVWAGAAFVPMEHMAKTCQEVPSDLVVIQRSPSLFGMRLPTKAAFLWSHDLLVARRIPELQAPLHAIDRIVTVSQFQAGQYRDACSELPESLFLPLRNGLDLDLILAAQERNKGIERDPNLIVYTSRPERGLDVMMLRVFPQILNRHQNARLVVAGYDCPNPALQPFYDGLAQSAAQFGGRVEFAGALSKDQLYDLYHRARVLAYPTPSPMDPMFAETSCITLMEAMACGLPVVASNKGALPETLAKGAGILVDLDGPHAASPRFVEAFTASVLTYLWDDDAAAAAGEVGRTHAQTLDWEPVAQAMVAEALAICRTESANPLRLARHFLGRQDLEAARQALARGLATPTMEPLEEAALEKLSAWVIDRFAHTRDAASLGAYYAEQVGPNNGHVADSLMRAPAERFFDEPFFRFGQLDAAIRNHFGLPQDHRQEPATKLKLLDFGCSQGECPVTLANRLRAQVVGVDASWSEIERARKLAQAKAKAPDDLTFVVGNETNATDRAWLEDTLRPLLGEGGQFDVVVMAEVLEHLINPIAVVEHLEAMVRPGGLVCITVPFGPWETQQPERLRGQHLREWGPSDLEEIFAGKKGLIVERLPLQHCPVTGEILGNTFVYYEADHKPLGAIDWERKLTTQRPRQTLSLCMMVGGANSHHTLHWAVGSVAGIADQIVVADTGMTDEARSILAGYGAEIVSSPPPLEVGFAAPRNAALDRCWGDWVLMLDDDEKLISGLTLARYLHENVYHCYAIPQHHFAVDATWKPDMPGRCFRRRPIAYDRQVNGEDGKPVLGEDGKPKTERVLGVMRFHGHLHEHAELGINQGAGPTVVLGDVAIAHVGYLDQMTRSGRFVRNLPMLKRDIEAHPDRKLALLVTLRDSVIQAKWLMAQAGMDPMAPGGARQHQQAHALCLDVVRLWERNFGGKGDRMSLDSLEHYHEACRMLGTDIVADIHVAVQRQGVGMPVGPAARHYATLDHVKSVINAQVQAVAEVLGNKWF